MSRNSAVTDQKHHQRKRYLLGLYAVIEREILKFGRQYGRLLSAIVRPSLWLFIFATGLQNLLGISIIPPYETYTPYQEYILPGLVGIIILFQCMQSALSMVYDREAGVMRVMLVTPLPRAFLLFAKILSATILAVLVAPRRRAPARTGDPKEAPIRGGRPPTRWPASVSELRRETPSGAPRDPV